MPQLFPRVADTFMRLGLWGMFLGVVLTACAALAVVRSPYITGQHITREQPIPFSHRHHVSDIGIDCRFCHGEVEDSPHAGLPETQVCMDCHRGLWTDSAMLEPVRASWRDDQPLHWRRVHDLPDYVYFDHSIHVHKGIGCYSCHGRIGEMPLTYQAEPLTMQWCLECHRDPEQHVRPRSLVFDPAPLEELTEREEYAEALDEAFGDQPESKKSVSDLRAHLAEEYELHGRTTCYTCHR